MLTTRPQSGTKQPFSIALTCTISRWIPMSTSSNRRPEGGDLILLGELPVGLWVLGRTASGQTDGRNRCHCVPTNSLALHFKKWQRIRWYFTASHFWGLKSTPHKNFQISQRCPLGNAVSKLDGFDSLGFKFSKNRNQQCTLTSQKVFMKSLCKSQFQHKFVTLFFIPVTLKNKLTDSCRN